MYFFIHIYFVHNTIALSEDRGCDAVPYQASGEGTAGYAAPYLLVLFSEDQSGAAPCVQVSDNREPGHAVLHVHHLSADHHRYGRHQSHGAVCHRDLCSLLYLSGIQPACIPVPGNAGAVQASAKI